MTRKLYYDIVNTTKQGRRRQPIEKYIIYKLKIVIGFLLNGDIEQAITDLKNVIAYLEDYISHK